LFILNSSAKASAANNSMQNDVFCKRSFAKFSKTINLSKIFINCVSLKEVEDIGNKTFMSCTGFLCRFPRKWVGSVWKKYSYRIYKLCLKKCGTKDEADDLFQEVALRFCKNASQLNNQVHLLPWLEAVLLHCHYNGYRKRHQMHEIPFSVLNEPKACYDARWADAYVPPEEGMCTEAILSEFSLLLEVLNPLEKMIVELSVVGGLSIRELSRLLGLSRGCLVRRRLMAFQKMEEKMVMQKDRIKMITGRDASLREIIEYTG